MAERSWGDLHKDAMTTITGDFPVIIVEASAVKSQNDKDMIKYKAKIETGPYAGRALSGNFVVSPESSGAMRMFFLHMAVLGLDEGFWAANPTAPMEHVAKMIEGRRAIATVGTRQWQGQDREEIQAWKKPTGPGGSAPVGVLGGFGGGLTATPATQLGGLVSPSTPATAASTPAETPAPTTEQSTPMTAPPELPF